MQLLAGAPPAARASMPLLQLPPDAQEHLFKVSAEIMQQNYKASTIKPQTANNKTTNPHNNTTPLTCSKLHNTPPP